MRPIYLIASLAAVAIAVPAAANLVAGATAPAFTASGAVAGKPVTFTLSKQLQKGTLVVAYFFPSAYTDDYEACAVASEPSYWTDMKCVPVACGVWRRGC